MQARDARLEMELKAIADREQRAAMAEENPSFIKLAMRNMVRKGRQSLFHFGLTALGLSGFLVLIAWLGRPQLPGG